MDRSLIYTVSQVVVVAVTTLVCLSLLSVGDLARFDVHEATAIRTEVETASLFEHSGALQPPEWFSTQKSHRSSRLTRKD